MKNKRTLWIAAGAAVLLLGLYLVLLQQKKQPETPGGQNDGGTAFSVMEIDVASVDSIRLFNGIREEQYRKVDGSWYIMRDNSYPVNGKSFQPVLDVLLSNLKAFRRLQKPAAASEYGINEQSLYLQAYAGEKKLVGIRLGQMLPTENQYYCQFDGDPDIYTVSPNYYKYMSIAWEQMVAKLEMPEISDSKLITSVCLSGSMGEFEAYHDAKSPWDYSGQAIFDWYFTKPYHGVINADYDTWYQQLKYYQGFRYLQVVEYMPRKPEAYGLDAPAATLAVSYTDTSGTENNQYVLRIGKADENGNFYAQLDGSEWVMLLKKDVVDILTRSSVYGWTYKPVFWPGSACFDTWTITGQKLALEYRFENQYDGTRMVTERIFENGEEIDWSRFERVQNILLMLRSCQRADDTKTYDGEVLFTLAAVSDQERYGKEDLFIEILAVDEQYCAIRINGAVEFLMNDREYDAMMAAFLE